MIHTRKTIFKTLQKRIRELTKHANPEEFKKILLAVILNDLKEWSEYIPKDNPFIIEDLLNNLLRDNCFIIERINNISHASYVNVNTPQTNNTWQRVWDRQSSKTSIPDKVTPTPEKKPWVPDPTCEIKLIYFYIDPDKGDESPKDYLDRVYGIYGENLKTICDKMNIYIDRESGEAWYLDNNDCTWKRVGGSSTNWTEQQILDAVKSKLTVSHQAATSEGIYSDIAETQNPIVFCSNQEVEDLV